MTFAIFPLIAVAGQEHLQDRLWLGFLPLTA